MNILILDHVGQAVGAKHVIVALLHRLFVDLHLDILFHTEGSCNIILVGRPLRFLLRVESAIDQFLQQRVVRRHLLKAIVPQPVQPGVTHMGDRHLVVVEQACHHRRPIPSH